MNLNMQTSLANGFSFSRSEGSAIHYISIDQITPNPFQPRRHFDELKLNELASTIKRYGVLQPLVIKKGQEGQCILITGERRLRAAKIAGLKKVPAIFQKASDYDMVFLALVENLQRDDLNPIEQAKTYQKLISMYHLTHEICALYVGKDRATITNLMRLLSLPIVIQEDIEKKQISMGHGRALLTLEKSELMLEVRNQVIQNKLSVRETERLCKNILAKKSAPLSENSKQKLGDPDFAYLAETLQELLHTKVKLLGNIKKGKIEISFFSTEELNQIIHLVSGNKIK